MPAGQRSKCKWDGGGIPGTRPQQPLAFDGHLRQPARRRMLGAGARGGPQGRKMTGKIAGSACRMLRTRHRALDSRNIISSKDLRSLEGTFIKL